MRGAMATALAILLLLLPALALAQEPSTSFDQLGARLKAGEAVRVTDDQGRQIRGRVLSVESTQVVLEGEAGRQELRPEDVRRVERYYRDSGVQGLLFGAVGGALGLWGIAAAGDADYANDPAVLPVLLGIGAAGGALVGYLIDRAIPGRQTVYVGARAGAAPVTLAVLPAVTPRAKGVVLSLSF